MVLRRMDVYKDGVLQTTKALMPKPNTTKNRQEMVRSMYSNLLKLARSNPKNCYWIELVKNN